MEMSFVEPTWMTTGQSAGTAAALAARTGKIVQDLDVKKLQKRLRAIGQILDCRESRQSSAGSNPGLCVLEKLYSIEKRGT